MTPVSYISDRRPYQGSDVSISVEHDSDAEGAIARAFVSARRECRPLPAYPAVLPGDLDTAYRIQDAAISLWPDVVAGWKVGAIPPDLQPFYGEERIVGPVFRRSIRPAPLGTEVEFPIFVGGFAAVEAEFVFEVGLDAPPGKVDWTSGEAAAAVARLHIGIEPASSPLASINEIGPVAVVSDFGNNAGLLLGPEVANWRERLVGGITCETWIEGDCVGRGGTGRLPRGPLGALAFALNRCARRGRPLRAGDLITTGAASGIHDILAGQSARLVFDGVGELRCRAVPATPAGPDTRPLTGEAVVQC
jgi:2-keto-4-pentenoate hydratase